MPDGVHRYGRATFLAVTAAGLSSLAWGDPLWRRLSSLGTLLPPSIVPSGWRIYTVAATMPRFDAATWRLEVGGLVDRPLSLTYEQLRALPRAEQVSDFHCVTGWSVSHVHWGGVRFSDLLAAAKPRHEGHALQFTSAEQPYVDSLTLAQALLPDVMLAHELDGRLLSRPHGAPARVVMPEMYGYKGVKWLTRMELVAREPTGYWEGLGYDQDAWVGRSNGYGS